MSRNIRVALWDRKTGRRIATRRGPNPQGDFGADVLNRLEAARANRFRTVDAAPTKPKVSGVQVLADYALAQLVPCLDWAPFFQT